MSERAPKLDARRPAAIGATPVRTGDDATTGAGGVPRWVKGIGPLVLLAILVFAFVRFGPLGVFRGAFPPVEELTIERVTLPEPNEMRVHVTNGGPEPVTIAQVLVDEASWVHEVDGDRTLQRLDSRTIRVPYPWVEGEPLAITLITRTGVTFTADVAVATRTPTPDARYLSTFALLGIYAGVIPVFLGLLWLPFLRSISREWLNFFLSLTIGLLVFLGVDALFEALELAALVPGAFNGLGIVLLGLVATPLAIAALGQWKRGQRPAHSTWWVATLVAIGIGLHNLGEGLAIGASYATGEIALGTFLVIGFLIHNTTEGLGIVAPIAGERPSLGRLALLGAIAGVPTVLGAWIGGFSFSPVWTTLFFAVGAGAIVQVVIELARLLGRGERTGLTMPLNAGGLVAGLALMYVTGLIVPA
jgi:zinc transporter, ZIP family